MCTATFTGSVLPDGTAQITAATFKGGLLSGGKDMVGLKHLEFAGAKGAVIRLGQCRATRRSD
jgi:hypothetical protein